MHSFHIFFTLSPPQQMAEHCPISSLNVSFCYKVPAQQIEIVISTLRAKGTLQSFKAMGTTLSSIGLELLSQTSSLTKLSLCGVALINDEAIEMVFNYYNLLSFYTLILNLQCIDCCEQRKGISKSRSLQLYCK